MEQDKDIQVSQNMKNIDLVKEMLEHMKSNDMPAALEKMTGDIDWQSPVTNTAAEPVSWAKPRRGREEVAAFFEEIYGKVRGFDTKFFSFTAQDDRVFVEGTTHGVVESTGLDFTTNWIMAFTIENGKVSRFRQYYDTAEITKAFERARKKRKAA